MWDGGKGDGERIIAERMTLDGARIEAAARYRVTVNNYLSDGGDGFTVFTHGANQLTGIYDVDALFDYFESNRPLGPPGRPHRPNELIAGPFGLPTLPKPPLALDWRINQGPL